MCVSPDCSRLPREMAAPHTPGCEDIAQAAVLSPQPPPRPAPLPGLGVARAAEATAAAVSASSALVIATLEHRRLGNATWTARVARTGVSPGGRPCCAWLVAFGRRRGCCRAQFGRANTTATCRFVSLPARTPHVKSCRQQRELRPRKRGRRRRWEAAPLRPAGAAWARFAEAARAALAECARPTRTSQALAPTTRPRGSSP